MWPKLNGIDHAHVYVDNWADAEEWFGKIFGFKRIDKLMIWAVDGGPLTVENPEGTVHLALFENSDRPPSTALAFGASGEQFLTWIKHLEAQGLELRITDHKLVYSLYFNDPWQNLYEITTEDRDYVADRLK